MKEINYRGFAITITKPQVRYVWEAVGEIHGIRYRKSGYSFYTIGDAEDDAETEIDSLWEAYSQAMGMV